MDWWSKIEYKNSITTGNDLKYIIELAVFWVLTQPMTFFIQKDR